MKDKNTILILGASSDVGRAFINKYGNEYQHIIAHCRNESALADIKEVMGSKLELIIEDFASDIDKNFLTRLNNRIDEIDEVLHLLSPKYHNTKITKCSWDYYQTSINIQVRSVVEIVIPLLAKMAKRKSGKVVIMLSSCTQNPTPKYIADYVTAKYALHGLIKAISAEFADKGICINGISPCMMETKLLENIPELIVEKNAQNNPHSRNARVDDILPMMEFLLSEKADFITGQNILITGGL